MVPDQSVTDLLRRHSDNGLLVDTNLLLLFVIGRYDHRRIVNFKRTATYTHRDFQRLGWLLDQFKHLWTTPNILTEVDNLGRQLPRNEWHGFAVSLSALTLRMIETMVPSANAAAGREFARLGLADTATLLADAKFLLLSDDLNLCLAAHRRSIDAINFNHLRMLGT